MFAHQTYRYSIPKHVGALVILTRISVLARVRDLLIAELGILLRKDESKNSWTIDNLNANRVKYVRWQYRESQV
jgi:hypothetical protein